MTAWIVVNVNCAFVTVLTIVSAGAVSVAAPPVTAVVSVVIVAVWHRPSPHGQSSRLANLRKAELKSNVSVLPINDAVLVKAVVAVNEFG